MNTKIILGAEVTQLDKERRVQDFQKKKSLDSKSHSTIILLSKH